MAAKIVFVDEPSRRNRRRVAEFEKGFRIVGFDDGIETSILAIRRARARALTLETICILEDLEKAMTRKAKLCRQ